jgi:hypothetical protein
MPPACSPPASTRTPPPRWPSSCALRTRHPDSPSHPGEVRPCVACQYWSAGRREIRRVRVPRGGGHSEMRGGANGAARELPVGVVRKLSLRGRVCAAVVTPPRLAISGRSSRIRPRATPACVRLRVAWSFAARAVQWGGVSHARRCRAERCRFLVRFPRWA